MTKQLTALAFTTMLTVGVSAPAMSTTDTTAIKSLPSEGYVSITGQVTDVDDANEFTVSDGTDSIEVESSQNVDVKRGDTVTVKGNMDTSWFSREVDARSVRVDKKGEMHLSDSRSGHTTNHDYDDKHWGNTHNNVDLTGKFIDNKGNLRFKSTAAATETRRNMIESSQYNSKPKDSYAERRTQ